MTTAPSQLNDALQDRYRIERELGQGGMATVYLAQDLKHDRKVAIKVLRPELAAVIGAARFLAEIKTTANLQHPHILPLHDSGEVNGTVFYVMPYVEGESLRDRLTREQQLPVGDAIRVATEVAGALEYAHQHGVIHRDIKPENILLHGGHALVADFGIALAVSRTDGSTRMTETGLSLGTPHYMSPEQAMGERTLDARTDVYALGCVLFEMLAGEPPFSGPSAQAIVAKVMAGEPTTLTTLRKTVPPHVNAVVQTAIQKLPADRFASAAEFAQALASPAFGTGALTAGIPPATPGLRRNRPALALGATALIATALAAWGWLRPEPPREVSRYSIRLKEGQGLGGAQTRIALTPDGSAFVYVGSAEANGALMVRRRDALTASPLGGTDQAVNPAISPDGSRVAFVTGSPRALKVVSLSGGAAVTLTDSLVDPGGTSWGYDGYVYYDGHLEGDGLARVRETGGTPEPVTTPDSTTGESWHYQPEALPDGRGLLFTVAFGGGTSYSVAATEIGTGRHTVLAQGLVPRYRDGFLFFVTPDGVLMAAGFDQRRLELTSEPVPVAEGIGLQGFGRADLTASRTGTLAYVAGSASSGLADLAWVARDGRATPVDTSWRRDIRDFVLSPDGRRAAVVIDNAGSGRDIWIKELISSGPAARLSFQAPINRNPFWAPDGSRVVFRALGDSTRAGLWSGPADGATLPAPLRTDVLPGSRGEYTRDGQWIVFEQTGDIFAVRTSGDTARVPLVVQPAPDVSPTVSPDGRWLAYASEESGQYEVYVRPFPETSLAKRIVSSRGGYSPRWSRDGRELYYMGVEGRLMAAPVLPGAAFAVGEPVALFSVAEYIRATRIVYEPAPDGRFLVARSNATAGEGQEEELIVVENFMEEVRAKVRPNR